ncbi:hypothetical protein [Saccharopolyspora sp. NPDC049357]|uniref:hypothetical protein n=1 Tax=Saccharopolyspora sp. NPDC049357 TaxID=3154507 RepID=UPI0034164EA0
MSLFFLLGWGLAALSLTVTPLVQALTSSTKRRRDEALWNVRFNAACTLRFVGAAGVIAGVIELLPLW